MKSSIGLKAAALLKRAEGIVTLVVCNPNKKDEKKEETSKTPKIEKKGKLRLLLTRQFCIVSVMFERYVHWLCELALSLILHATHHIWN